jgi:multidrug efflux system membrane fusion protein
MIKVGPVDGNFQAVLSGLKPGDRVVTDGTDRLRDGASVTLPAAQAGGQGGTGGAGRPQSAGPGSASPADPSGQHEHRRQQQAQ